MRPGDDLGTATDVWRPGRANLSLARMAGVRLCFLGALPTGRLQINVAQKSWRLSRHGGILAPAASLAARLPAKDPFSSDERARADGRELAHGLALARRLPAGVLRDLLKANWS